MRRHLRPVDQPARPRRLNSRREIEQWAAERYAVLTALMAAETRATALGTADHGEHDQQLSLEAVA